ncbi:hypothetical protein DL546_009125 [Coniochaeta pulveracea]|uniref:Uncharacterized protein n=1 Tax=Coniochaeta pulveracea TaxID=177199 RepID=A0A420YIH0_9PEZI|nr:hypothetical protein DL546_009125 [Coniochaeta pulveracea]
MSSRSGSESKPKRSPKKPVQTQEASDGEESAEELPPPARRPRRQPRQQRQQGGGSLLDGAGLDGVTNTAGGLVNGVTGALGGVAGQAVQNQGGGDKGKSDTLRLRLDLNLDIEITLKAKIHGDLELALLYVYLSFYGSSPSFSPSFLMQPPTSRLVLPVVPGGWLHDSVVAHVPDFGQHGNILIHSVLPASSPTSAPKSCTLLVG